MRHIPRKSNLTARPGGPRCPLLCLPALVLLLAACQPGGRQRAGTADSLTPPPAALIGAAPVVNDPVPARVEYVYHLQGSINDMYGIVAHLVTNGDVLAGHYKYTKQDNWISLEGSRRGAALHLEHRVSARDTSLVIEVFDGTVADTAVRGGWLLDGRDQALPFVLVPLRGGRMSADHAFVTNSVYDDGDSCWRFTQIKVYDDKGRLAQVIDGIDVKLVRNTLYLEDLNNDGHWDLLATDSAPPAAPIAVWIYQPAGARFEADTAAWLYRPRRLFYFVEAEAGRTSP